MVCGMSQLQQINDFLTHGISWKPLSWNENYENTIILIDNSEEYFLAWPEKLLFKVQLFCTTWFYHMEPQTISWPEKIYFFRHDLRTWSLRLGLDLNDFSQCWHGKFSPSMWVSACSLALDFFVDILPHGWHKNFPSGCFSIIVSICWSTSSMFWKSEEWRVIILSLV